MLWTDWALVSPSTCLTAVRLVRLLLSAMTMACESKLDGWYWGESDLLYTGTTSRWMNIYSGMTCWALVFMLLQSYCDMAAVPWLPWTDWQPCDSEAAVVLAAEERREAAAGMRWAARLWNRLPCCLWQAPSEVAWRLNLWNSIDVGLRIFPLITKWEIKGTNVTNEKGGLPQTHDAGHWGHDEALWGCRWGRQTVQGG